MTWFRMPLFCWSLYATSVILVLATPVLAITLLLVAGEHLFGIGVFDPRLGGDPLLFQDPFWFYSHPAVYIMILPAMGVMSLGRSLGSRRPGMADLIAAAQAQLLGNADRRFEAYDYPPEATHGRS